MRPRLAPHRIAFVKKLLQPKRQGGGGMSQRAASIASGVALRIVNEIAQGGRGDQFSEDAQVEFQNVNPYTCPTCERLVNTAPCVTCTSRGSHSINSMAGKLRKKRGA